jgi:hypothetical protein
MAAPLILGLCVREGRFCERPQLRTGLKMGALEIFGGSCGGMLIV